MSSRTICTHAIRALMLAGSLAVVAPAHAAESVFGTGANSLVDFALEIATPIAILLVIGVGIAAAAGRIAWGWVLGVVVGIAVIFGSPQLITWVRDLFAV